MTRHNNLLDTVVEIVDCAKPGESIEAYAVNEQETEIRAYKGEVESLTSATVQGIGIRVVNKGRQGFSYAVSLDNETLQNTLEEARDNCQFASADEFAGVAAPDGVEPVLLDLYRADLQTYATEKKIELALDLEKAALSADTRIKNIETADYYDTIYSNAVATSSGVAAESQETNCFLVVQSLAEDKNDTQSGLGYSVARHPDDLSVLEAANDAAKRATGLLGAKQLPSGRISIVLDPHVSARFLGIIGATLNGESVLKGRSLFTDKLNTLVAAPLITLTDDATNPLAYSAGSIDAEGLATRKIPLIVDGVLRSFLYDTYTAQRAGVDGTGSAVRAGFMGMPCVGAHALQLLPGKRSQADMIADITDGLLVQNVVGLHSGINLVSGDFSIGAQGIRIRNGALAEPVREVTIASTLQRLLLNVIEVGSDLKWLPMNAAGMSLAIDDVVMSGI